MYFSELHGQATSASPAASGAPTECTAGTKKPSSPIASRAVLPIRVMIFIEMTTYGESVISTPSAEIGEPSGPMQNGTTYIVRPVMQPAKRPPSVCRISARRHPVVGGAGVLLCLRADERTALDPGDVGGIGLGVEGVGALVGVEPDQRARVDQLAGDAVPLLLGAVAPLRPGPASSARRSHGPRPAGGRALWARRRDLGS